MKENKNLIAMGLAGAAVYLAFMATPPPEPPKPVAPLPVAPVTPPPSPPPKPQPRPGPWAVCSSPVGEDEPAVDALAMPKDCRKHNISARGSGCCTFRATEYAGWWQGVSAVLGFPEWLVQKGKSGGGTPGIMDREIKAIAADRGLPTPGFVQYEGQDTLLIEAALKTGRMPCITWGGNHMLNCVYCDAQRAAILDNNAPDQLKWMSRTEFMRGYTAGGGGWTLVLLECGPPPCPRNAAVRSYATNLRDRGPRRHRRRRKPVYGVGTWQRAATPRYRIDGRRATEIEVIRTLGADMPDDSAKPFLTVYGGTVEVKTVLADLDGNPALAPWKGRVRVKGYEAGNPLAWAVAPTFGYPAPGRPTIVYQSPDGRVLHRQGDYNGGAEALAGALRKADPSYQPDKDPDCRKPSLPGMPGKVPPVSYLLGGLAALLFLKKEKE